MSESRPRHAKPPLYYGGGSAPSGERAEGPRSGREAGDESGWEAYRRWLSMGRRERATRASLDRSVYSWNGYQNWANRVKQAWKPEDS